MVIYGKTDRETLQNKTSVSRKISVFKGTPKVINTYKDGGESKYPEYGKDLTDFFRLEILDPKIKAKIIKAYSSPQEQKDYQQKVREILAKTNSRLAEKDNDTSVYLAEIPIYLAYKDLERTFDSYNGKYSGRSDIISGLIHKCDGRQIYEENVPYTDRVGHQRSKLVSCDRPCQKANPNEDCPLGCRGQGTLSFYLPVLLDLNILDLSILTVHGDTDIREIANYLYEIEEEYGSATLAPGAWFSHNKVRYLMTRRKLKIKRPLMSKNESYVPASKKPKHLRTGKKTDDWTWAVQLQVDPDWINRYRQILNLNNLKQLGYQPTPKAIAQAYDFVEVEARVIEQLPGGYHSQPLLNSWQISDGEIEELRQLWTTHNWTKEGLENLLRSRYDLARNNLRSLSKEQFDELKVNLQNDICQQMFC